MTTVDETCPECGGDGMGEDGTTVDLCPECYGSGVVGVELRIATQRAYVELHRLNMLASEAFATYCEEQQRLWADYEAKRAAWSRQLTRCKELSDREMWGHSTPLPPEEDEDVCCD